MTSDRIEEKRLELIDSRIDQFYAFFDQFTEMELVSMAEECYRYLLNFRNMCLNTKYCCANLIDKAYRQTGITDLFPMYTYSRKI